MTEGIDPEEFDAMEQIKAKLDVIAESQERIEGRLEGMQATLDTLTMRPPGPIGGAPRRPR